MKKKLKQILAALLVAVMLVGIAPMGGIDMIVSKANALDSSVLKYNTKYVSSNESLMDEYKPYAIFYEDGSFVFWENMLEGFGYCLGTYEISGSKITVKVSDINFSNNSIKEIIFTISDTGLILQTNLYTSRVGRSFIPSENTKYNRFNVFNFGRYPQSKVTDITLILKLKLAGSKYQWNDYNYYAGTGWSDSNMHTLADGSMEPVANMMRYKDILYDGNMYRAVEINQYRPIFTGDTSSESNSLQDDNGYYTGNTYYFKYEPLTWRVLDPDEGYVMCNQIIDSQAYQNFIYYNGSDCYNSKDCTAYASDWVTSSLRQWLNDDFYNTAFTDEEKSQIGISHLENKSTYSSTYDSADTDDKIFAISYDDAINSAYGFSSSYSVYDTARQMKGTDYAKCHGLWVYNDTDSSYSGNSWWWLRSPCFSGDATVVDGDGWACYNYYGCDVSHTSKGILPAFKFNQKYNIGDTIEFGSYPQSKVTDSDLIAAIESAGESASWVDYNYYAGTGEWADGEMKPVADMMLYKDIIYGGNKYRAVKINQYRPIRTYYTSSESNSCQDYNGYYTGNTYYFKYEPLTWRVLDPDEGYVMCNQIIDSQAYQNFIYYNGSSYYNSKGCANYASDWVTSSLRQWLNDDFYNTAFTDEEKSQIGTSHLENKNTYSSTYDSADTDDKIFPISYDDAINSAYGFNTDRTACDTARQMKGTDYAKCQGLWVYNDTDSSYNGTSWWWLRSPCGSDYAAGVGIGGWANYGYGVYGTDEGILPAFKFNPKSTIIHSHTLKHITVPSSCTVNGMEYDICTECGEVFNEKIVPMGHKLNHVVVPSTCKVAGMEYDICTECGETFNEKTLAKLAHTWGEWTVVKEATTTAEGLEKRTCSACGEVETRAIEKLKALIDKKTGVEIVYNNEYDANTEIKVEEKFDGDSFQLVNSAYGEVKTSIFDIATYKNGAKVQPDGEITVRIPLPSGYSNKVFVCYVDSTNGKVTKIPCEVKDGYVTFKTNHFSEYAIVEQSANVKSVSIGDITMNYKKSAKINPTIAADDGAEYTVKYTSSDSSVARVDDNGNVYGAKRGSATITCTVTDSNGNTVQDTCTVTVKYSFGQWLIKILLFGWIWY